MSQQQLADKLVLSKSTINDLENHNRYDINIKTLNKFLTIFNEEFLLDDYTRFILNQEYEFDKFKNIRLYICRNLKIHRSTYERYEKGLLRVKYNTYKKIRELLE